jgi:hypothetical protein
VLRGRQPDDAVISLTLRLLLEHGPIAGEIEDDDGETTPFRGWMDLAARLEASRRAAGEEGTCEAS